jgi:FixJ family two-component response regulator
MKEAAPTVFVVDDDADLRESLGWLFESAGLRFKCYSTAHEFLTDYKPEEPGCLLLDVRMPEVMDLVIARKPNKIIAAGLGISPKTVEIHRALVMEKMQVESVAELVRLELLCRANQADGVDSE